MPEIKDLCLMEDKQIMFNSFSLNELDFDKYNKIAVAFSGGVDSSVLLHLLTSQLKERDKEKVVVIHVNHLISPNSDSWEEHCKNFCASLKINFVSLKIESLNNSKINENSLREARYEALLSFIDSGDVLLTGHHLDDHLETILFRILRGTGIRGLIGIEKISKIKGVDLIRPLLNHDKESLVEYAKVNKIKWVQDESNSDISISRNFIRKNVLPNLKNKNWPEYHQSFSHLAGQAKDANEILDEVFELDLKYCSSEFKEKISIEKIKQLSRPRVLNLIFKWLNLNTPLGVSSKLVEEIYENVIFASDGSNPIISLGKKEDKGSFQIRRFNGFLYCLPLTEAKHLNNKIWKWDPKVPLKLPTGTLSTEFSSGIGLSSKFTKYSLHVQGRMGGERCKPQGRAKSQKLKKLLQEYQVPPWIRDRIPMVYVGDKLAAVSDLWVCEDFLARKDETGIVLKWDDNLRY